MRCDAGVEQRTVVITGASSGIGAAAAGSLAARGHRIVPLGRDAVRTTAVAAQVGAEPVVADFADLGAVRRAAETILATTDRIDVLALNAGGLVLDRRVTRDGIEQTMQMNHLAHFLLERLLHQRLLDSRATVVLTCSIGAHAGRLDLDDPRHERRRYRPFGAYADSKLAGLLFVRELSRRTPELQALAYHPGTAETGFATAAGGRLAAQQASGSPVLKRLARVRPVADAARTLVRLAAMPAPRGLGGHYLGPGGGEALLPRAARDRRLAQALWAASERLTSSP